MDKKMLNTISEFELADGRVVQMTLTYFSLLQLKSKKKGVYDRYNAVMVQGPKEELDNVLILYTAYLCANIKNDDECLSEMEFLELMPISREYVGAVLGNLLNPKKK